MEFFKKKKEAGALTRVPNLLFAIIRTNNVNNALCIDLVILFCVPLLAKYLYSPTRIAVDCRNARGTQSRAFQPLSPRRNLRENSPFTCWIVATEISKKKSYAKLTSIPTVSKDTIYRGEPFRTLVAYDRCHLDVVKSNEPYVRNSVKRKSQERKKERKKEGNFIERYTPSSRAFFFLAEQVETRDDTSLTRRARARHRVG